MTRELAETRQIVALLLLTSVVGISGVFAVVFLPSVLEGDLVVDEYSVTFHVNGTLIEDYTYEVKASNQYRMLFRSWDVPLSIGLLDRPHVELVGAQSSSLQQIVYARDYQGSVWVEDRFRNDPQVVALVRSMSGLNEVGVLKVDRFPAGRHKVRYVFIVHPPLECDGELCHVNLQLASEHLAYRNIKVTVEDEGYSAAAYLRPPPSKQIRDQHRIVFYGSAARDELVELELLFKKDILETLRGYPRQVSNVRELTVQANTLFIIQRRGVQLLSEGAKATALLIPGILALLYVMFGREKRFVVPKYLSTVPNRERKPWVVNLVFKSDAFDFDENGFYATVLDLHRQGKIRIEETDQALSIRILELAGGDSYESRTLRFLSDVSKNGVVSANSIKEFAENLGSTGGGWLKLAHIQTELNYLLREAEPSVASQFMVSGRKRILPIALVSAALLCASVLGMFLLPNFSSILTSALVSSLASMFESVIAVAFPSTLFGKWLGQSYKEKLEWDSFRRFLADLAQIRKYPPEDLSMWGEWLVYGTALGVGDAVAKAMKELKIELPESKLALHMPVLFTPLMVAGLPSGARGGVVMSGGGGGFGAGGGFGGGGAGGRR